MAIWNNLFGKKNQSEESSNIQHNPNYQTFANVNQDIQAIVNAKSVVSNAAKEQNKRYANPSWQTFFDGDILALPIATNKVERIAQYRRIAEYSVCDWCFDEIADDFIHEDENGEIIKLTLPDRLTAIQREILLNEFQKYIELFRLKDDGYNMIKRFLTEGELAWENVISPTHPDMGIIGVKFLPAEYYETLIDTATARPVGIVFDVAAFTEETRQLYRNSFVGAASIFNAIYPTTYRFTFTKDTCIPLLYSQITYINSGEYSHDFLVSYPLIEKAKQAYYKLALLEDAAVILRVTRAPERLLFNVSTGRLDQNRADEYVRRFANSLVSKKVSARDGQDIASTYSPITMLKSYVFGKSSESDGTTVESVGSSASYDEIADIEYFLRAFLKMFKVPFSRWKTPENTMEKNDAISSEEYTFSRMVMRFQRRFAEGFKRGFITHLKLRGIWDKKDYGLNEYDIQLDFNSPVLYDLYEKQKLTEAKMAIYKAFTDNDEMSKSLCMKKYLGWTDDEVKENYMALIYDKQWIATAEMMGERISEENPPVEIKSPMKLKKDVEELEKTFSNDVSKAEESPAEGGEGQVGGEASEGEAPSEENAEEEPAKQPETPTFGLG